MYAFQLILVSVYSLPMYLPRLPHSRIDKARPPPLKIAYFAYYRYFSGKMYDFQLILVSVYSLPMYLPRLPHTRIDTAPRDRI